MLLLFIGFCCGMVVIAGISLASGNPRRIVYGTDSWGNYCGQDNGAAIPNVTNSGLDLSSKPYLYYG